jgi:hypothetical protein
MSKQIAFLPLSEPMAVGIMGALRRHSRDRLFAGDSCTLTVKPGRRSLFGERMNGALKQ